MKWALCCLLLAFANNIVNADISGQYNSTILLNTGKNMTFHWTLDTANTKLHVGLQGLASGAQYLAFGISPDGGMVGSKAVIGFSSSVLAYNLNSQTPSGVVPLSVDPLITKNITASGGYVMIQVSFDYTGALNINPSALTHIIWAYGSTSGAAVQQHANQGALNIQFNQPSYICSPSCQNSGTCGAGNVCNCVGGYFGNLCQNAPGSDPLASDFDFNAMLGVVKLYWTVNSTTKTTKFAAKATTTGYVAVGFSSSGLMIGSRAVLGFVSGGVASVKQYELVSKTGSDIAATAFDELVSSRAVEANGVTTIFFELNTSSTRFPVSLSSSTEMIWAVGSSDALVTHADKGSATVDFFTGSSAAGGKPKKIGAHGWLMTLSWGVLVPIAIHIARFEKKHDPLWFKLHYSIQTVALVMYVIAFALIVSYVGDVGNKHFSIGHAILGLIIFIMGLLNFIAGVFRPHKGTPMRPYFEFLHHNNGRIAVVLSFINVFTGLHRYGANDAYTIVFAVWIALFLSISVFREVKARLGKNDIADTEMHANE